MRGEGSALLTADGVAELVAALPDGRGLAIPGAGLNVQLERPAQVLGALEEFLAPFI